MVAFYSTGGGVKGKKIYTCWLYYLFINLHLFYLWRHLAHRPPVTLQFMALPSSWWFNSWFGLQIQQSSGVLPWQVLFSSVTAKIEWNLHVLAQLLSYSHEITSKKRLLLWVFCLGKLANVLLRNFITTHWEHFLTHWYNALMVAQNSCGCWCSLTTAFTVLINGT